MVHTEVYNIQTSIFYAKWKCNRIARQMEIFNFEDWVVINVQMCTISQHIVEYLKTAPFTPSAFENEMITHAEFEGMACQNVQVLAAPASQRLYRDIAMARRWSRNKQGEWGSMEVVT